MHHEFPVTGPVRLTVELGGGSVSIRAGDVTTATVDVSGPRADRFAVELRGDRLDVIGPRRPFDFGSDDHVVVITVPSDGDLSVRTGSADVEATGRHVRVRIRTGSGDVDVEAATGPLVISTGSGDIRCDTVEAEVRVKTGSGDVELGRLHRSAVVSTGSGDVTLGLAGRSTVVKTGSGTVAVERVTGDLRITTGSGRVRLRRAERGEIRARTGSASIEVGVPAGTPVWTEITSTTGRVASGLAPVGRPADGQDHVALRLNTATGDITLTQA